MKLPAALLAVLPDFQSAEPVGGGCISPAARIRTASGEVFAKWSASASPMFGCEAKALRALRASQAVRTPEVIAVGADFIALEWLPRAPSSAQAWSALGRQLADLHHTRSDQFGWEEDNFIGSLHQSNQRSANWAEFWRDQRLDPQLRQALQNGALKREDAAGFARLYGQLSELLSIAREEGPALLHGDLWNGNAYPTDGGIALIDPSAYYGHREVDLAMADLFGGFPAAFWAGYHDAWPLAPGAAQRRAVYQLYYLLVHINLFGGGYVEQTRNVLARLLRA